MNNKIFSLIIVIITAAIFVYLISDLVHGDDTSISARIKWNCTNFFTAPQPIPLDLKNDASGNWDVLLADGSMLYGKRYNGYMKWTLDDMWWHTNGVDVVYCESDAKALSILMAQ